MHLQARVFALQAVMTIASTSMTSSSINTHIVDVENDHAQYLPEKT
jgi:hypothetical protein